MTTKLSLDEIKIRAQQSAIQAQINKLQEKPTASPQELRKAYHNAYSRTYHSLKSKNYGSQGAYSTSPVKNPQALIQKLQAKLNNAA